MAKTTNYVSAAEAHDLLASGLAARQRRSQAEDMMSTKEAAEFLGKSRATIIAWITKGRAIGLRQGGRGFRMPRWQFKPNMWEAMLQLAAALGTKEGWALLAFLETPHGGLDGLTPREAIEQGQGKRVVELALAEGT